MKRRWQLLFASGLLLGAVQCGSMAPSPDGSTPDSDARGDSGPPPIGGCGADSDRDGIPDAFETMADTDMDGTPNHLDTDSDNDGRLDGDEASATSASYDCRMRPADSDRDGNPDFLDTDSDDNGILDAVEFQGLGTPPDEGWPARPVDTDSDGTPDYADSDDDNDGIPDRVEIGADPANPPDTDMDGRPDWRDTDSDGDTIADRIETTADSDSDGTPNYRDLDSDNDGTDDRTEAQSMPMRTRTDINEPPFECPTEVNPANLSMVQPDGFPNYIDGDSDNDGLGDREERMIGTDVCSPDSDGDGQLDVVEHAYCQRNRRMGCATDGDPALRPQDYYLILPFDGPPQRAL